MQAVPGGFSSLPTAVWLLFAAPTAALLLGFFALRPARPRWTHWPILASCAIVAASAVALASRVYLEGYGLDLPLADWMIAGNWGVSFGVRVDGLSASMLAMIGIVGGLIHVYASGYMAEDPSFSRFFLAFHLFFLAMIGLVLSNNYAQLYLFWELTGLASFLLIGHWHHKKSARAAAFQAFMTNRIGDFGLLLGVLVLMSQPVFRSTRFEVVFRFIAAGEPALTWLAGLLFFWAACGKSAQFPLYFWLPDAMEGPTPVSALMHAATMVTAGIFLLARSWPLIAAVADLSGLIAFVGALTAVGAAVLAGTRTDLKRILAYSTVSHLGIMTFALGLGQPAAAVFHLITHGFFKAALFLCAGNIAHALHQPSASLDDVGGLRRSMPLTFACFLAAALSLAGVWPLAGFYSKDAVLDAALHAGGWRAAAGLLIAAGSAFYIFRMLFLSFFGPSPRQRAAHHFHEAEPVMAVPVFFLSLGAIGAGWLHHGLSAMLTQRSTFPALPELSLSIALIGTAATAAGAAAAYLCCIASPEWDWAWRERRPGLARFFEADFGCKPAVAFLGGFADRFASRAGARDKSIVDAAFEGAAGLARGLGAAASALATGLVNDYLWWMLAGTAALLAGAIRFGAKP